MEVILLESIKNLGKLGDKINVKPGYARNYLIPERKAVFPTPENIKLFESRRAELEKKAQVALAAAEQRAAKLNDTVVVISAMASEEGKLYGSVGVGEIKEALAAKSIDISKREISMPNGPIYSVGEHVVEVHLHSEVVANLQIQVEAAK